MARAPRMRSVSRAALWWVVTLACLPSVLAAEKDAGARPAPEPELKPGTEVRIDNDKVGGYFLVYVPTDYAPDRTWPAIFCYHGQNGKPTTWPFRPVTDGKGFIIAGMEYLEPAGKVWVGRAFDRYMAREMESFRTVRAYLARRLSVDKKRCLVGGFSMGGWMSSSLGEAGPQSWAGICILGAGRQGLDKPLDNLSAVRGRPIFIGAGTHDPNFFHARKAGEFYKKHGANVTFEEFPGLGHTMDTAKCDLLRKWLAAFAGPKAIEPETPAKNAYRDCRTWLALADNYLSVGKSDKAREYLQKVVATYPDTPWAAEARTRLEKLDKGGK